MNRREIYWDTIRTRVNSLNPEFAALIDQLSPDKKLPLLLFQHQYGEYIQSSTYSKSQGFYLILKGCYQKYLESQKRVVPISLARPGDLFFPNNAWPDNLKVTAGARTLFLLAKISDRISHERLRREVGIHEQHPSHHWEHWHIFRELTRKLHNSHPWDSEVVYFPAQWVNHFTDSEWNDLQKYLAKQYHQNHAYWKDYYIWNYTLANIRALTKIKASHYHHQTVKHILAVAATGLPGFTPAIDDSVGPISLIESLYLDIYRLKNYQPILMQPNYKEKKPSSLINYISLQIPSALELTQKKRTRVSVITDLLTIKELLQEYITAINTVCAEELIHSLKMGAEKTNFAFTHSNFNDRPELTSVSDLKQKDQRFNIASKKYPDRAFPEESTFFKGCIRLEQLSTEC